MTAPVPVPPAPPVPPVSPTSPLRVLVTGASTVLWSSWMGGPRGDYAFPRVLEDELRARGRDAEVRCCAVLGSPVSDLFRQWEQQVLQWSPDVIVSSVGHYESLHLVLPHWYERYSNRVDRVPGPLRSRWRRTAVRPAWKVAVTVQARLDARAPAALARRRARRLARRFAAYVDLCQQVASPAQLVLEVLPPAGKAAGWFPGMTRRAELINAGLRGVVERRALPHVQFVETSRVAEKLYGDDRRAAQPDGLHFTPDLHRELGRALADRIMDWDESRPVVR